MQGLISQLEQSMHKPQSRWIFFKKRENERLELDRQRVSMLLDTIRSLRLANEELVYLKAETFLSPQKVALIIENKMTLLREQFALEIDKVKRDRQELVNEDTIIKKRIETLDLENEKRRAEINETNARTQLILSQSETEKSRAEKELAAAEMIRFIISHINPDDLLPHHKTYIIQAIANPHGNQYQDLEMGKEIMQDMLNRGKVLTEQERHKATELMHKADLTGTQSELERIKKNKQYPELVK